MSETARQTSQHAMQSVLDREISDQSKDAFGHQHFAGVLGNLIEAEHHLPPFSIGLLGSWGTGKSTIKELYLAALKNDPAGARGKGGRIVFTPSRSMPGDMAATRTSSAHCYGMHLSNWGATT